jgi:hypothetical protein
MFKAKLKKCRGTGKALGFGCGELYTPTSSMHKGLCNKCYPKWLYSTPAGKDCIEKSTLKAKKVIHTEQIKKSRTEKKEIISNDEYRERYVQPIINEIARLIDYGQPCIATGLYSGKMNGGHYHSVGSNRTLALNLHNIHIQGYHSNSWKGGDNMNYRLGLIRVYGQEYADMVESLKSTPALHLSKTDLIMIKSKASIARVFLKKNLIIRPPEARIIMRDEINQMIGIYK